MKEIKIGKQIWAAENLNVDIMPNGSLIREVKTNLEWHNAYKSNEPAFYQGADGKLYNYFAFTGGVGYSSFEGWKLPTLKDWNQLIQHLGGYAITGYKLKNKHGWRQDHSYVSKDEVICPNCYSWNETYRSKVPCHECKDTRKIIIAHNGNGSNEVGFNAIPGCIHGGVPRDESTALEFMSSKLARWWLPEQDYFSELSEDKNWKLVWYKLNGFLEFLGYPGSYPAVTIREDYTDLFVNMISKVDGAAIRLIKIE